MYDESDGTMRAMEFFDRILDAVAGKDPEVKAAVLRMRGWLKSVWKETPWAS